MKVARSNQPYVLAAWRRLAKFGQAAPHGSQVIWNIALAASSVSELRRRSSCGCFGQVSAACYQAKPPGLRSPQRDCRNGGLPTAVHHSVHAHVPRPQLNCTCTAERQLSENGLNVLRLVRVPLPSQSLNIPKPQINRQKFGAHFSSTA